MKKNKEGVEMENVLDNKPVCKQLQKMEHSLLDVPFLNTPIFTSEKVLINKASTQKLLEEQQSIISVFDVKKLYDLAHSEQAAGCEEARFKTILAEALRLDMEYRRQLAKYKE